MLLQLHSEAVIIEVYQDIKCCSSKLVTFWLSPFFLCRDNVVSPVTLKEGQSHLNSAIARAFFGSVLKKIENRSCNFIYNQSFLMIFFFIFYHLSRGKYSDFLSKGKKLKCMKRKNRMVCNLVGTPAF